MLGLLAGAAAPGAAQTESATLTGTVKNEQSGVLPGATVTAVHTGTSAVRETAANAAGNFVLPLLQHERP